MHHASLITHIRKFVPLTDEEAQWLGEFVTTHQLEKKEFLLEEGQVCHASHFVVKGCLRMYCITEKGTEQIVQFAIENWWIADFASLLSGSPSNFNIQSIEATEVLSMSKREEDRIFERIPRLEKYFRIILQRAHAAAINRIYYIFDQSGEERYHSFSTQFPEFVQRVPQYMLASYLGFTPEFLSKIRGKKH